MLQKGKSESKIHSLFYCFTKLKISTKGPHTLCWPKSIIQNDIYICMPINVYYIYIFIKYVYAPLATLHLHQKTTLFRAFPFHLKNENQKMKMPLFNIFSPFYRFLLRKICWGTEKNSRKNSSSPPHNSHHPLPNQLIYVRVEHTLHLPHESGVTTWNVKTKIRTKIRKSRRKTVWHFPQEENFRFSPNATSRPPATHLPSSRFLLHSLPRPHSILSHSIIVLFSFCSCCWGVLG